MIKVTDSVTEERWKGEAVSSVDTQVQGLPKSPSRGHRGQTLLSLYTAYDRPYLLLFPGSIQWA